MTAAELFAHPFLKHLLDEIRPLTVASVERIQDELARSGRLQVSGEPPKLSESDQYKLSVFWTATAMADAIGRLDQAATYMTAPPPRSIRRSSAANRYNWAVYHYSYYMLTLVGLTDMGLLLVNAVLRLGNAERQCRREVILGNSWVNGTRVAAALRQLEKAVKPHSAPRNLHVHRGIMPELAEMPGSLFGRHLKTHEFLQEAGRPLLPKKTLSEAWRLETMTMRAATQAQVSQAAGAVENLFDAVKPSYEKTAHILRGNVNA